MPKKKKNVIDDTFDSTLDSTLDETIEDDKIDICSNSAESSESDDYDESDNLDDCIKSKKRKGINPNKKISFRLNEDDLDLSSEENNNLNNKKSIITTISTKYIKTNNRSTLNTPWIEKYRPVNVNDLVLEEGTFNKIKKIIDEKNMPNIIITGVPGIGKTTTILCIAKNLLGKFYEQGVLELNASDERGIKTVQESIEYFCKKKLIIDEKYAQHKIVLLDEADNMTHKAQQSINNLIKQYHETTRFAFTCNKSSDIIEAIQSRCIILRYGRLNNIQIAEKLQKICEIEKVPYTKEGINAIVITAQGDLRKAINNLQLTYNGYIKIIPENVYMLCDKPHPMTLQYIFEACYKGDIRTALQQLNTLREKGYSSSDISFSMINMLKNAQLTSIDEETKIKYMEEISKACLIISKGMNTPLQLTGAICALCIKK